MRLGKRCFLSISFSPQSSPYGNLEDDSTHSSSIVIPLILPHVWLKMGLHIIHCQIVVLLREKGGYCLWLCCANRHNLGISMANTNIFSPVSKFSCSVAPLCTPKPVYPQLSLYPETSLSKVPNPREKCFISMIKKRNDQRKTVLGEL